LAILEPPTKRAGESCQSVSSGQGHNITDWKSSIRDIHCEQQTLYWHKYD